MVAPYVPHYFGRKVDEKLRSRIGWLTAGVASSIPWPKSDIWLVYNSDDYIIRGTERDGRASPPGITVPCDNGEIDTALGKVLRFTSILSWFMRGYVDVSGYVTSSHPITYGDARNVFSNLGIGSDKYFNCNHLPIIEDENIRKALAFWREGCRLARVHDGYSFLSFYKVIESQFNNGLQRAKWIESNIELLEGRAARRVLALKAQGISVSDHIYKSGRCAIAHASFNGEIVDPDIPEDRRLIYEDLDVIQGLAMRYIGNVLNVPDEMSLHKIRNRLEPWFPIIPKHLLKELIDGKLPDGLEALNGIPVSVGIWPDGPILEFEQMPLEVVGGVNGLIVIRLENARKTIRIEFVLDFPKGRAHTQLKTGGLLYASASVTEADVIAYTSYFNRVLGNQIVELYIDGCDPVDCDVVIPVNIMAMGLDEAIELALKRHKKIIEKRKLEFF